MSACPTEPNPPEIEALYPEGSTPFLIEDGQSSLCSIGHSPMRMTGVLKHIILQHFGDTRNIVDPDLRAWLETRGRQQTAATGENTPLYVEAWERWTPTKTEANPGVIIKSHDWTWQSIGINDHMETDVRTGEHKYGGYWIGSHTVFPSSCDSGVAQSLGLELAKLFLWFRPIVQKSFRLERFVLAKFGAVATLKPATKKTYTTPITVSYAMGEAWSILEDAPRLKRIVLTTQH